MATMTAHFMTWKDSWSVGVTEIDAQHKNLVSLVNQLHMAMREGKGKNVLGTTLDSLVHYTKAHFATEERLLLQSSYPGLSAHKREHTELTEKVVEFQRTFQSNGAILTVEVMHFLSKWLQDHICGSDKKYAPFLHARGVR